MDTADWEQDPPVVGQEPTMIEDFARDAYDSSEIGREPAVGGQAFSLPS
ncbi:hypothetical protein [Rhodococcus sp. ABRD24]|nr:hypothetical protein [Rhodococcus sp. ABRD24]